MTRHLVRSGDTLTDPRAISSWLAARQRLLAASRGGSDFAPLSPAGSQRPAFREAPVAMTEPRAFPEAGLPPLVSGNPMAGAS